jgi:hypothetical protein
VATRARSARHDLSRRIGEITQYLPPDGDAFQRDRRLTSSLAGTRRWQQILADHVAHHPTLIRN